MTTNYALAACCLSFVACGDAFTTPFDGDAGSEDAPTLGNHEEAEVSSDAGGEDAVDAGAILADAGPDALDAGDEFACVPFDAASMHTSHPCDNSAVSLPPGYVVYWYSGGCGAWPHVPKECACANSYNCACLKKYNSPCESIGNGQWVRCDQDAGAAPTVTCQ